MKNIYTYGKVRPPGFNSGARQSDDDGNPSVQNPSLGKPLAGTF